MVKLSSHITIGEYTFKGVVDFEVDSTWENLTDVCKIKLPRKVQWQGRLLASGQTPVLKRLMPVVVEIGCDDFITEVFRGVLRDIGSGTPVELTCEDNMYLLKKGEFTKAYRSVSLSQLLKDMLPDWVKYKVVAEVELGAFRISKASPAKVLEQLRETYFIQSWFREDVLYVGLAYVGDLQRKRVFAFNKNVIEHSLEYRQKEDVKILLKAVIMKSDNTKEEVEIGEQDGDVRNFHYTDLTKEAAKERLEKEAERLRYTGYRGLFTTFGKPDVRHGDLVTIKDDVYPERDGTYLVKKVLVRFGTEGYRQEIELESKQD